MIEIVETTETEIATAVDEVEAVAKANTPKPYLLSIDEKRRRRTDNQ